MLRPLLREKVRTLLTLLGIAVGVAVVVAIQLANQSSLRVFRESVDAVSGRANYQIVADAGFVDERLLLRLRPFWREGVRFAPVIDVEGMIETDGEAQPVRLLAVDLLSDLHFRDYRFAHIDVTRRPRSAVTVGEWGAGLEDYLPLFRPDAIVLPAPFAREHGLAVGSAVTLSVMGRRQPMVLRGILEYRGPATAFNGSIAVCDVATAQTAFALGGRLSRIDLLVPPKREAEILRRLQLPPGTRVERPSRRNERVEKMLRAFRVNLFALAGVALLVGMFLVYNTMLISILRRRRDVGILKTVGVSPRQILAAFLAEGLLFGLAGSAVGVLLGKGIAGGILRIVGRTVNTLYVASRPEVIELTAGVIALGIGVGTIFSVLSALHPAIEAARIAPTAMIRPGLQQRVHHGRLLIVTAVVCFVAGGLMSLLPPVGGIAVAGYGAVLLVVAGFSLLAPAIVSGTARAASPLLIRLFGLVGRLSAVALPASLRRTSIAGAALSLAIGMMVAVALMVGSFRETVRIWVNQTVTSDLWLRPSRGLTNAQVALFPPSIAADLNRMPFIAAIDRTRGRDVLHGDTIITVGSGDFAVAAARSELPMVAPRSPRPALLEAVRRGGVLVSESYSIRFGKRVGDPVDLPTARGPRRLPITGIYRDYSNDRGTVVMDRELYVRLFDDDAINTVMVYLKDGVGLASARRALEKSLGAKYGAFVVSNAEVRREVMKIFDQTFRITWALLAVALVVAVLGIINTLAALILERTRELALLRVSGLSSRELTTMLVLESSLLGLASVVSGLLMGFALSWILIHVINRQSFGWTIDFYVPGLLIAGSLGAVLAVSALSGFVPARLARNIDIAAAIKSE